MPCDTQLLPQQTMSQRMAEIRDYTTKIDTLIAQGRVKIKVGPQGAVVFVDLQTADRGRMTDGCIYRRLIATGSVKTKLAIQRAEQIAGVQINKQIVAQGIHSHNGGASWHPRG